jgi:hypothetical protein
MRPLLQSMPAVKGSRSALSDPAPRFPYRWRQFTFLAAADGPCEPRSPQSDGIA